MLRILQISITFIFVIICTTTAETKERPPKVPRCEGDICYCVNGTHEALFKGRKYCATDSTEPCPEYAIRLSPQVCECKKGYRFLNDDRKTCVPEHMKQTTTEGTTLTTEATTTAAEQPTEQPTMAPRCAGDICYCVNGTHEAFFNGRKYCATDSTDPCPDYAFRLSPQVCECKKGYRFLNEDRKVCVPEHMKQTTTEGTTLATEATTTPAEQPTMVPRCEGDICYCVNGTHEAFFRGRKYCERDSTDPCPEYAVRLSPQICECEKGYRFLNDDRSVCVPEETVDPAEDEETANISTTTQRLNMTITTETTPTTTNIITTTRTQPDRSCESEILSNTLYIYVSIIVLVITALLLLYSCGFKLNASAEKCKKNYK